MGYYLIYSKRYCEQKCLISAMLYTHCSRGASSTLAYFFLAPLAGSFLFLGGGEAGAAQTGASFSFSFDIVIPAWLASAATISSSLRPPAKTTEHESHER